MPRFCEVFEKRLNVFTFPIKNVRFNNKRLFTDLKPTFRGNVSFKYVNPLFILDARNSVFDLKMARPENIFQKRHINKQISNIAAIYRSGPYFAVFTFVLINRFN